MSATIALQQGIATPQTTVVHKRAVTWSRTLAASPEADWTRLLQRTAHGDQSALAELYDATSSLVFGLALRILGDRDNAEDALIEVYQQAWRAAADYDATRGSVSAWLLTLTRSRSIDMLRAKRREYASDPLEAANHIEAANADPETAVADAERHRCVRRALQSLREDERQVIELAYYSGLSHSEIATRLGHPLGTVKTRIRLGMLRLREALEEPPYPPTASVEDIR